MRKLYYLFVLIAVSMFSVNANAASVAVSDSLNVAPAMTDDDAAELFMTEYESLQKQFTMVYNTTVNADSIEMKADTAFISRQTFILNSIYKNMAELETWAMESMEAGTLAQDVEEILASFENIQIQLTQFYNTFWEELNGDEPGMTDEEAAELFMTEYESLQKQFTMVYNTTVNADSIEMKADTAFISRQTFILNSIYKNMAELETWAMESMEAGTLAQDVEEILASFENIQIQLTQFYNTFWEELNGDEPGMTDEEAAELFMTEYESLQKQFTMVYNTTVNADSIEMKADTAFISRQTFILNSIYKNMAELETWAMESMEAGTLAQDVEEILASFENIQIQLTQFYNTFWDELNGDEPGMTDDDAAELFMTEYESLQKQFTMVYNTTVNADSIEMKADTAFISRQTFILNSIYKNMAELETWAMESMEAGTLAQDVEEILASFENIQIQLTQFYNTFWDELNGDEPGMTDEEAAELFMTEYESLQKQFTMVYNTTVNADSIEMKADTAFISRQTFILNSIYKNMAELETWAMESMEAGTLAQDVEEILASFENIQIQLTQFYNTFWDELNGDEPGMTDEEAAELFMTEYESLQKQFTMVYNTTVNADSIEMKADTAFISRQTFILNSIYKNMAELETWAMESMEAGTLAQDVEEILASFENIQIQLTQFYNTFWDELNGGEDDPTLSNEEAWMMFVEDFGEFYDLLNLDVENLLNIFFGEMIDSADITMEDVAAIVGDSAIMEIQYNFELAKKVVGEFYARAEASYNNGTFGEQYYDFMAEADESIEYVIERLSDSLEAIVEKVAREIVSQMFMQAIEQAQIGLTQIYNATINNPDYEKYSAELESLIPEFNKISMYLQSIVDTASVYYENGVLVDRIDEISDMLDKLGLMLVQFESDFESVLANAIKVSVDTPESDSVNTEIFTINGVKVDNMNEPGIYIVNGKKIVVR